MVGGGVFEGGYRLTKDKLLRLQYMPEGLKQFTVQGLRTAASGPASEQVGF